MKKIKKSVLATNQSYSGMQEWYPLKIYLYYRILISFILLPLSFLELKEAVLGTYLPFLYFCTAIGYIIVCMASWLMSFFIKKITNYFTFTLILTDMLALSLLMWASGGKNNNLSILLIVTIAASGVLIRGKMPFFFAAIATISTLMQAIYFSWLNALNQGSLLSASFIGITFFGTSLISQYISKKIQQSEISAKKAENELHELQELNNLILQRMRTGIIVTDRHYTIKMVNNSALTFLNLEEESAILSKQIDFSFQNYATRWLENPNVAPLICQISRDTTEVIVHITEIMIKEKKGFLFFIEDNTRLAHQAQQIKLASLGRLTVSIAHEIRNPLSSISHASQLLSESQDLQNSDIKLTKIIHENCIRVNLIIENIQNLSKRQKAAIQLFDLNTWITHFIEEYSQYKKDCHIKTYFSSPEIFVPFDPPQLTQIMNNIVDNGLRYSEMHTGKKTIMLSTGITTSDHPFIDIEDQGKGISDEIISNLFEPFFTTEHKGTGLGLYLSREICQANYAQLDFILKKNGGACFRVTFAHPRKKIIQ